MLLVLGFMLKAADDSEMSTLTDDTFYYSSLTNSADFKFKPVYQPASFTANELFEDIKVTAVESIPFGFFLTFAALWIDKAIEGRTISPNIGTLQTNENIYIPAIAAFATINVAVNIFTYYDYSKPKKKEDTAGKNKDKP
jgi:hypothetical protein